MGMATDLDTTTMDQHGELVVDGAEVEEEVVLEVVLARHQELEQLLVSAGQDADKWNNLMW